MRGKSNSTRVGASFVLLALVAACGSTGSSTDGGTSNNGTSGDAGDSGSSTDVSDSGTLRDSGTSDGGTWTDAGDSWTSDGGASTDAGDGGIPQAPTVLLEAPINGASGVSLNEHVSATFSEAMDPSTIAAATFTVTSGSPAVSVPGTVTYANSKAVFWPASQLAPNASFAVTITTDARSASGLPLAMNNTWSFSTGNVMEPRAPVDLGTAGQYVILAETGISTVAVSAVTGALGLSPAAATYITGFSLMLDSTGVFWTSSQVTGKVYAADNATPSPVNLTTAVDDMGTAFTAAAGRAPDVTELGAGNIGGMTLPAGVYSWGSGLLIPASITLTGSGTDVWIFQIAQNLTVNNGAQIVLANGAQAQNVFWQVSGGAALGTTAQFEGIILCQTAITLGTGASITGRLLAQTAVTLEANTVVAP